MADVRLLEEVDDSIENLIRRAATLLSFDLSEVEVRCLLVDDSTATEAVVFFAIKAAVILNR